MEAHLKKLAEILVVMQIGLPTYADSFDLERHLAAGTHAGLNRQGFACIVNARYIRIKNPAPADRTIINVGAPNCLEAKTCTGFVGSELPAGRSGKSPIALVRVGGTMEISEEPPS